MRNVAFLAGIAACSAIVLSTATWAQDNYGDDVARLDKRFYIAPMGTYTVFDDSRNLEDLFSGALTLGKVLGRGMNLELTAYIDSVSVDSGDNAGTEGEFTGYAATFLAFPKRDSWPFYAVLSINKNFYEVDGFENQHTDADGMDAGIGYWLGLGRWPLIGHGPALRIEARYRHSRLPSGEAQTYSDQFGLSTAPRSYSDYVAVIGLNIPIGPDPNRPEPEPKQETAREPVRIVQTFRDSDADGVIDDDDACPGTPRRTPVDERGCSLDADGDGVANDQDRCPNTPAGAKVDASGCSTDADGDGVGNDKDQCPNTPAGTQVLADGCALTNDCRIPSAGMKVDAQGCAVTDTVILQGVNFETGSNRLTSNAKVILDRVADALLATSRISVEIIGHTDSVGAEQMNLDLSVRRASAVKIYLQSRGVSSERLLTRGLGESQPAASNASAEGREQNRRVELKVKEQ